MIWSFYLSQKFRDIPQSAFLIFDNKMKEIYFYCEYFSAKIMFFNILFIFY